MNALDHIRAINQEKNDAVGDRAWHDCDRSVTPKSGGEVPMDRGRLSETSGI